MSHLGSCNIPAKPNKTRNKKSRCIFFLHKKFILTVNKIHANMVKLVLYSGPSCVPVRVRFTKCISQAHWIGSNFFLLSNLDHLTIYTNDSDAKIYTSLFIRSFRSGNITTICVMLTFWCLKKIEMNTVKLLTKKSTP